MVSTHDKLLSFFKFQIQDSDVAKNEASGDTSEDEEVEYLDAESNVHCPVPECNNSKLDLKKHWYECHVPYVVLYLCSDCYHIMGDHDRLEHHYIDVHGYEQDNDSLQEALSGTLIYGYFNEDYLPPDQYHIKQVDTMQAEARESMVVEFPDSYQCPVDSCGAQFKRVSGSSVIDTINKWRSHWNTTHVPLVQMFYCPKCNYNCSSLRVLMNHVKTEGKKEKRQMQRPHRRVTVEMLLSKTKEVKNKNYEDPGVYKMGWRDITAVDTEASSKPSKVNTSPPKPEIKPEPETTLVTIKTEHESKDSKKYILPKNIKVETVPVSENSSVVSEVIDTNAALKAAGLLVEAKAEIVRDSSSETEGRHTTKAADRRDNKDEANKSKLESFKENVKKDIKDDRHKKNKDKITKSKLKIESEFSEGESTEEEKHRKSKDKKATKSKQKPAKVESRSSDSESSEDESEDKKYRKRKDKKASKSKRKSGKIESELSENEPSSDEDGRDKISRKSKANIQMKSKSKSGVLSQVSSDDIKLKSDVCVVIKKLTKEEISKATKRRAESLLSDSDMSVSDKYSKVHSDESGSHRHKSKSSKRKADSRHQVVDFKRAKNDSRSPSTSKRERKSVKEIVDSDFDSSSELD